MEKEEVQRDPSLEFIDLISVDMAAPSEVITKQIMDQMMNLGFLLLSNIPDYDEDALFEHQKWFFALSDDVKRKLYKNHFLKENQNYYRGLAPFIENDPSHKELYEVGLDISKVSDEEKQYPLHEETPWPEVEGSERFKKFMTHHYDVMHKVGIKIMQHVAEGLGKPADFFDGWFLTNTCSTFRIIRYLPRSTQLVA